MYRLVGLTGVIGRFSAQGLTRAAPVPVIPAVRCTRGYEMKKALTGANGG